MTLQLFFMIFHILHPATLSAERHFPATGQWANHVTNCAWQTAHIIASLWNVVCVFWALIVITARLVGRIGSGVRVSASFHIFHNTKQDVDIVGKNGVTGVRTKNSTRTIYVSIWESSELITWPTTQDKQPA